MPIRSLLICEPAPFANLRPHQFVFSNSDIQIAPGGVGERRDRVGEFLGGNVDSFQVEEMALLHCQKLVPL